MKKHTYSSLDEYFRIKYVAGIFYPPVLYMFIQMLMQVIGSWYCSFRYVQGTSDVTAQQSMQMTEEIQALMYQYAYVMNLGAALLGCIVFLVIFRKHQTESGRKGLVCQLREIETYRLGFPILLACLANLGCSRLASLFSSGEAWQQYEESSRQLLSGPLAVQLLTVAVLVPVVEELIYRGLVFSRARRYLNDTQAMLFSSLLFGFFHFNLIQGLYAFVMGMLFSYVYHKYDNIWYCIFMHGAANGTAVLIRYFFITKFINRHIVVYVIVMMLELAAAFWCLCQLHRNQNEVTETDLAWKE